MNYEMTGFSLLQSTDLAEIVGVCIILSIVLGALSLMWRDYKNYLEENDDKHFHVLDFVLKEQLYIFIFLVLAFLVGGEMLLQAYM
jgi:hypothetical protein